ncbi:bifunctional phosphoribosylaminoimidazolecarboxamide formyltransferase/IMP cyclohydrolase [Prochlorococcus sp. MIT 1307]|uniref:bifunctional phosphoribosylaminoimidazolecarboxamide formyltransferase/IMP cyclohydrolase n=1 Tax=Prochlorococcus sp. MIT 1307 TaxID=3096219 RepID=UPI002A75EBEE|nr:bifunctional phosphoribosylaminoimidazolecarboxamide formyltransferase/IMP cyclohydrolase [Prochlorococcus sp. MIT 1307]
MAPIALLSVSDKEGLVPLAKTLTEDYGYQIISSGGTAKSLEEANVVVTRVADYTGSPEILDGRVKTLHPRVHGGILAKRTESTHLRDLEQQNISKIDLVVVNLYPFQQTVTDPNVHWETAIENIDIGGPAMVRAAAKNHSDVVILTNPNQYRYFLDALKADQVTEQMRQKFALEAFEHTAAYDVAISNWIAEKLKLDKSQWLEVLPLQQKLRYGENPHQCASWYSSKNKGWGGATQLQGKELSTNNLLDLEAALSTVREFGYSNDETNPDKQKAAVVVKHTNPCGVAISTSSCDAISRALEADRVSAFGGIVALNYSVNSEAATLLTNLFLECVVAPSFDKGAREILSKKPNLRLLQLTPESLTQVSKNHARSILGGILVQDQDNQIIRPESWRVVTKRCPTEKEKKDLAFAWSLVRHVRSNAIVIASSGQSLGIGAGQMNRVGSAKLALDASGEKAKGAVLASDGFFPFDDTVKMSGEYGIKAIIQPGGSIRDKDSIAACDELGITMLFTGMRHFLH